MKIVLMSPAGAMYRCSSGSFRKALRYAPLTLSTLAALVPDELGAEIEIIDEGVQRLPDRIEAGESVKSITGSYFETAARLLEVDPENVRVRNAWIVGDGPVDVLVVRESYLQQHGSAVRQLVKKWFDTLAYQAREPDDTAQRISRRLGITPDEFVQSLEGLKIPDHRDNVGLIGGDAPALVQSAQRLQKTMTTHGLLDQPLPVAELVDGGAL